MDYYQQQFKTYLEFHNQDLEDQLTVLKNETKRPECRDADRLMAMVERISLIIFRNKLAIFGGVNLRERYSRSLDEILDLVDYEIEDIEHIMGKIRKIV